MSEELLRRWVGRYTFVVELEFVCGKEDGWKKSDDVECFPRFGEVPARSPNQG